MSGPAQPGEQAADLSLLDEHGKRLPLSSIARGGPLLVLVFQGTEDEAGLRLLRDYRDATMALRKTGVALCAVAPADPSALAFMRVERGLGFPLFADPGTELARWGMFDQTGLLLLDKRLVVKQRASGARAPAEAMITFLKRGGHAGSGWRERVSRALYSIARALQPRRLAR